MYIYVYKYPNEKRVTSVMIPIYKEIQKKRKRKENERELRIIAMFLIFSHASSAINMNAQEKRKTPKRNEKKLLSIVRNEDHCEQRTQ